MTNKRLNNFTAISFSKYQIEITTLILALVVRLIHLDKSIWLDEAWALKFAAASFGDLITNNWERNPPLYYLILKGWIAIFGDSEFSIRFPSVIFAILSIFAFGKLVNKIFNSKVAMLSMLLIALSPAQLDASQTARTYSLLCLASVCSFYSYILWCEKQNIYRSMFFISSASLMIYSHHFGILNLVAIVAHSLYLLLGKKVKLGETFLNYFLIFLLYLPYLPFIGSQSTRLSQIGFWIEPLTPASFIWLFDYLAIRSGCFVAGILIIFLCLLSLSIAIKHSKLTYLLALWIIVPLILASYYSLTVTSIFLDRYFITLCFPVAALLSFAIYQIQSRYIRILLAGGYLIFQTYFCAFTIIKVKEDWKSLAQLVQDNYQNGDLLIIHPLPYKYAFEYYSLIQVHTAQDLPKLIEVNKYKRLWIIELSTNPANTTEKINHLEHFKRINIEGKFSLTGYNLLQAAE